MKTPSRSPKFSLVALANLFLAASAFPQHAQPARIQPSCGPSDIHFEVRTSKSHVDPAQTIEAGKAEIYVFGQIFTKPPFFAPTKVRIGLDGQWVGATQNNSYFAFPVLPGEHHLCTQGPRTNPRDVAVTSFTVEAGKRYYFRARFSYSFALSLDPLNPDEAKLLISSSTLSTPTPKK